MSTCALGLLSEELIKLASRQRSASLSYYLPRVFESYVFVSHFGPALTIIDFWLTEQSRSCTVQIRIIWNFFPFTLVPKAALNKWFILQKERLVT